jgi:hypothetical protein
MGRIPEGQGREVKLHARIGLRGSIRALVSVMPGKVPDVKMPDEMPVSEDAMYTMHRGYVDFAHLCAIHKFAPRRTSSLCDPALRLRSVPVKRK